MKHQARGESRESKYALDTGPGMGITQRGGLNVTERFKQIAIGSAGSIVTLIIVAIWGWVSGGGLIYSLDGVTQPDLATIQDDLRAAQDGLAKTKAVLEATQDRLRQGDGACEWVDIGKDRSHYPERFPEPWCSAGSFITQIDVNSCSGDDAGCPIIGRVRCCKVLSSR